MNETEFKLKYKFQPAHTCWNCFYHYGDKAGALACNHPEFATDWGCRRFIVLPFTTCGAWKFIKEDDNTVE